MARTRSRAVQGDSVTPGERRNSTRSRRTEFTWSSRLRGRSVISRKQLSAGEDRVASEPIAKSVLFTTTALGLAGFFGTEINFLSAHPERDSISGERS